MGRATHFVYILASWRRTLYVGVSNDLARRFRQHGETEARTLAKRYGVRRLVYFETCADVRDAIRREKQIKGWIRARKVALIEAVNPEWRELGVDGCSGGEVRGSDPSLRSG